jgi:NitT/TauT family transport system substrate-binding protein
MRSSLAAAVAVVLVTTACSSEAHTTPTPTQVDNVTYLTGFGAVGRDAFAWVALEKGYFQAAGIKVEIRKGAGNVPNLTALKAGQAQFAAMDFAGAEILAGQGRFTEWRAVAAIHQQTLVSIMTTKSSGITGPAGLAHKKIATASGSVSELLFPAYARLAGLDPKTVTMQGTQPTALNGLMAKHRVDAVSTFLLSKTALEAATKEPIVVMPYSDYLKNLYGNVIVTRSQVLDADPGLVQRFTTAALKGLQYSLDHPDEAAAILNRAEPSASIPAAVGEIMAMKPYSGGIYVGRLDEQRVTASINELTRASLMPPGLTASQVADFDFVH